MDDPSIVRIVFYYYATNCAQRIYARRVFTPLDFEFINIDNTINGARLKS